MKIDTKGKNEMTMPIIKSSKWAHAISELAIECPHYRNKDGDGPNPYHIVNAAGSLGFAEITDENVDAVIAALKANAVDPAPAEPARESDAVVPQSAQRTWTEAPASANVRAAYKGLDWQFTVRADTLRELMARVGWLAGYLNSQHTKPAVQPTAQPQPPAQGASVPPTTQMPQAQVTQEQGTLTFAADTLTALVNEGKAYWKVKGGKFQKFGVTVWPEVLAEAGWSVEELSPMKIYSLAGYTATYVLNDKGKPEKVTSLTKSA
jgi:hypothetical protein